MQQQLNRRSYGGLTAMSFVCMGLLIGAVPCGLAADVSWTGGTGDWTDANWSGGVPADTYETSWSVYIPNNSDEVTIASGSQQSGQVWLYGSSSAPPTLKVAGGTLTLKKSAADYSSLRMGAPNGNPAADYGAAFIMTGGVLNIAYIFMHCQYDNLVGGNESYADITFGSPTATGMPELNMTGNFTSQGRNGHPMHHTTVLSGYGSISADGALVLGDENPYGTDLFEVRGGHLYLSFDGGMQLGIKSWDGNEDAYTIRYVLDDTGASTIHFGDDLQFGRVPPSYNYTFFDLALDPSYDHSPGQVFTILSTTGVFANSAQFRNMGDGKRFSADGYRFEAAYNTDTTPKTFTVTAIDDGILYATDFEDFYLGDIDGQETFSDSANNFTIAETVDSGEYAGGLAVTTDQHNVYLFLDSDVLPDTSAAHITLSVDIQPNTTVDGPVFLMSLKDGTPWLGPRFGLGDWNPDGNGELQLLLRSTNDGAYTYGNTLGDRSDHWLRFTFTYGFGDDRGTLTLYDLTDSEWIDTGLSNVALGSWELIETTSPGFRVRAYNSDGADGGMKLDNPTYSLVPPQGTLITVK